MADFFLIGLSHVSAPVEIRERFANLCVSGLPGADGESLEAVTVLTCNRVEAYFFGEEDQALAVFSAWLAREGRSFGEIEPHVYRHRGDEAVRHLLKVVAGLDSMVLGENQILHQVKDSYQAAAGAGSVGKCLHALFQRALEVGKRVRSETRISENTVSIASAAVEMARSIFGPLDGCRALVIGAGEMASLVARSLRDRGVGGLLFTNRTRGRAEEMARTFGGQAAPLEDLDRLLREADVLISSTGAPRPIIDRTRLAAVMADRPDRPLFAIDIAVPRDLAPDCGDLDNVFLYDIDDLQNVADEGLSRRRQEAALATAIVEQEVARFQETLESFAMAPLVVALRERAEALRRAELEKAFPPGRPLDPHLLAEIDRLTRSLMAKWLHHPTVALKARATAPAGELASLAALFGLDRPAPPPLASPTSSSANVSVPISGPPSVPSSAPSPEPSSGPPTASSFAHSGAPSSCPPSPATAQCPVPSDGGGGSPFPQPFPPSPSSSSSVPSSATPAQSPDAFSAGNPPVPSSSSRSPSSSSSVPSSATPAQSPDAFSAGDPPVPSSSSRSPSSSSSVPFPATPAQSPDAFSAGDPPVPSSFSHSPSDTTSLPPRLASRLRAVDTRASPPKGKTNP
ncbi:MAG: glutamyl-tRNA reductase [Candidatus Riflebacteria bacterium]|nr:glutamyl-tRNA reductase [Candidatus Riflebacteria bacterium]